MKKIKILCVLNSLDKCNGISSYIMNYYSKINHNKIKYDFLITDDNICEEYKDEIEKNGDKIILTHRIKLKNCFKEIKSLKTIMKQGNYDIVYSHILYTAFFYFFVAKSLKIKHRIIHSHNTPTKNKNIIKEVLYRIMSKLAVIEANHYFACSEHAGRYLFGKRKFEIVKNAINVEEYFFDENIRNQYRKNFNLEKRLVLGNVGRLSMQKNQIFLIDVMTRLVEKNQNVKLLLIGDGEDKEKLIAYVKEKNLDNYIEFLGIRSDVKNLFQAIDVFVFPSLFEGLGIAAIEAQMSGLPCILSKSVPYEVALNENVKFLDINNNNIDDWCENIFKYQDLPRVCDKEKLKNSGYDIEKEVSKLENLFEAVVKN